MESVYFLCGENLQYEYFLIQHNLTLFLINRIKNVNTDQIGIVFYEA